MVVSEEANLQPWTTQTVIAVTILAIVSVCLRLLSRYAKRQPLWWDDWMILWSMAWNLLVVGFIFGMLACGMGLHADIVPLPKIVLMAKLLVVAEILYAFNLVWTKLSLLMMYYRIFRFPYFKKWAYIIGSFIIAWVICVTFLFIFICVPVQKLWYPDLPGRCINQVGTWIANALSTIVSDLATLILPIPQVWKLHLKTTEKVALTCAFGLGSFVIFASAYRFSVLFSYSSADPTYTLAHTVGWTAIEMSAGIVSACLPTMGPAFQLIGRKCGIKPRTPAQGSSNISHSASNGRGVQDSSRGGSRRKSQGPFHYLPSEDAKYIGHGSETGDEEMDLRPDHGHYASAKAGRTNSCGNDEVPLNSIAVHKKFTQVTT
ncbi:hypothetical protein HYFRA_00001620 [Hymenoscyphus fraxineus]|uniref:Rhodopsin domain-containing protein n=1 Tax=Hymenoscyphus fraxineus TaxID=746836 RepID=A0A9N9L579_9HELO|nr:hypothetical protein HYFRA_00001620 [Hymenoscyphus fraxineus]